MKNINNLQLSESTLVCNIELVVEQSQPTLVYKEPTLIFEQYSTRIIYIKNKHEIIALLI